MLRPLLVALACLAAAPAHALSPVSPSPSPSIDLYTMGRGEDLFSAFGHAAICVHDARTPWGRCYNYGTADFQTPLPLTVSFVRGRARFWVSVLDQPRMLGYYAREGRAVWRQALPLPALQAEALAAALEASTDEKVKYYRYHHFDDNCTTRIRDLIDRATFGALRANSVDRGRTFRQWARDGFAGNWPLLAAVELFLGRSADRRTDSWSAMFLPSELRAVVEDRLGAHPELVLAGRYGPLEGSRTAGHAAFVIIGALLAALLLAGARIGRRVYRVALFATGVALGLLGLVLDTLALLSSFPELTRNEALLIFWPTDLALGLIPRRWLRGYVLVRLIALGILALAHLGLLSQPAAPLLYAGLPLFAVLYLEPRIRSDTPDDA